MNYRRKSCERNPSGLRQTAGERPCQVIVTPGKATQFCEQNGRVMISMKLQGKENIAPDRATEGQPTLSIAAAVPRVWRARSTRRISRVHVATHRRSGAKVQEFRMNVDTSSGLEVPPSSHDTILDSTFKGPHDEAKPHTSMQCGEGETRVFYRFRRIVEQENSRSAYIFSGYEVHLCSYLTPGSFSRGVFVKVFGMWHPLTAWSATAVRRTTVQRTITGAKSKLLQEAKRFGGKRLVGGRRIVYTPT